MDKLKDIHVRLGALYDELMDVYCLLQAVSNDLPPDKKDAAVPNSYFVGWSWRKVDDVANQLDVIALEVHNLANNKKGCP